MSKKKAGMGKNLVFATVNSSQKGIESTDWNLLVSSNEWKTTFQMSFLQTSHLYGLSIMQRFATEDTTSQQN